MALDILIVDDEQDIRDLVSGVLDDEGYGTRTAASAAVFLCAGERSLKVRAWSVPRRCEAGRMPA